MRRYECDCCGQIIEDEGAWRRFHKYAYHMQDNDFAFVTPVLCYCKSCNRYTDAQIGIRAIYWANYGWSLEQEYSFFDKLFKTKRYKRKMKEIEEANLFYYWSYLMGDTVTSCINCGSHDIELYDNKDSLEGAKCTCGKGRLKELVTQEDQTERLIYRKPKPQLITPKRNPFEEVHGKRIYLIQARRWEQEQRIYEYIQHM